MTNHASADSRAWSQSAALVFALLVAAFGAFPYGVLYGFPILASLTLRGAPHWLRITVGVTAVGLFLVTLVVEVSNY